jgi:hypothetical protein
MKKLSLVLGVFFVVGMVAYGSGWQDEGIYVRLNNIGDQVIIGSQNRPGGQQTGLAKVYIVNGEQYLVLAKNFLNSARLRLRADDTQGGIIEYTHNDPLRFHTGSVPTVERMRIEGNGNIGIGTTNPSYKLDVAGTVQMSGLRIPTDAVNGYVLTSDGDGLGTWQPVGSGGGGSSLWNIGSGNDIYYDEEDGNVGIGTSSPEEKLEIADGGLLVRLENPYILLDDQDDGFRWRIDENHHDLRFLMSEDNGSSWTGMFKVLENGYFGIGMKYPQSKLDVAGTVQMDGFKMPEGAINGYVLTSDGDGVGTWQAVGGGGTSYWLPSGDDDIYYGVDDGEDVGIGTSTPSCKLDVLGDINIGISNVFKFGGDDFIKREGSTSGFSIGRNTGSVQTRCVYIGDNTGGSNAVSNVTALGYYAANSNEASNLIAIGYHAGEGNTGATAVAIGTQAGIDNTGDYLTALGYRAGAGNGGDNVVAIGYQAGASNSTSNVFIVRQSNVNTTPLIYGDFSNGSVGIGTTDLQAALTVNGTIKAEEIKVAVDIQPDYVFEDDYNLMSLNKLEKHIKENKHLPGIPSSEEAVKNGLEVGDMQTKLLEKVEELTLYVIEQDKELTELKKEVGNLKKENRELHQKISSSSN